MKVLVKGITWAGHPAVVACDGRCTKSWGINQRPKVQLSDDPDDFAFKADHELGRAPCGPGTYKGECAKPSDYSDPHRQNKWCSRECERSVLIQPAGPIVLPDFSRRVPNIQPEAEHG